MTALAVSLPAPLPAARDGARTGAAPHHAPARQGTQAAVLPGVASGSLVHTLAGEQRVEALRAGAILTDSQGRLHSLRQRITLRPARAQLVRIAPGALDLRARLDRDLLVGAAQEILFDDWRTRLLHGGAAPVPARRLCDDMLIAAETAMAPELHVLVTARRVLLRVNGLHVLSCDPALAARLKATRTA